MQIDGGCHCGHVTYRAEIDPDQVSICHCADCQKLTGSPFRVTAMAAKDDLEITSHPPRVYKKFGDNGHARYQYFCPECGSPLFTKGEGADADIWGIRWGSINQRADLAPRSQKWRQSSAPFLDEIMDLPASDRD
jgi:hypothetical protein